MEGRKFGRTLACPPPFAEAIPSPFAPGSISPPHSVILVAAPSMTAEEEATRLKKGKAKTQKDHVEVPVAPSPSPGPPVIPEHKHGTPRLLAPETLSSEVDPVVRGKKREENQVAAAPMLEPVEEAWEKVETEKRNNRRKRGEEAASPSQSAVAEAPIKAGNVVMLALEQGKMKRRRLEEQEQSSQSPLSFDVHPQGGKEVAEGSKCENVAARSSSKMNRMPSFRKMIRMRIEARKQQPLPESLLDAVRSAANPGTNSTDENSSHSSPFGRFFDQFCYTPDRLQSPNSSTFPETPDRRARRPPRGRVSSEPSKLGANGTSQAANTPILNASVSLSQEAVQAKGDEKPEKKMNGKKKQRKPNVLLRTTSEKLSDKYRRVPLDQLVPPPRSPHKLLQEKYASDPWKVIVICMLLNLTQGKQVRKKVKGFFKRYPDPQTACRADPDKMEEYLSPLGLQHVKTERIQRFSKEYVEKEWTYITELCGVGKYAADAYAIFCAGKATEVVPKDHKLVDYWKYVCFDLPLIQESGNAQELEMNDELEKVVPKVQELAVCC